MNWPDLPDRVTGSLCTYRVSLVPGFDDDAIEGMTDGEAATIRIKQTLPAHNRWQVFFHELLHAAELESGDLYLKDDVGDSHVDRLATALLALWVRNRWTLPGA